MALLDKHPRDIRMQDGDGDGEVAAVIDLDEFQEARNDPAWLAFQAEAQAYRASLREDGRSS